MENSVFYFFTFSLSGGVWPTSNKKKKERVGQDILVISQIPKFLIRCLSWFWGFVLSGIIGQ